MRNVIPIALATIVSVIAPAPLHPQVQSSPSRIMAMAADSIAIFGDTARAVALLDAEVRRNRRNADAWHQLGLLLWGQARSERSEMFMRDARAIRLLIAADSSLRMATLLAPDSARFWSSLGEFNVTSGQSLQRFAAGSNSRKALQAAIKADDSLLIATAATGAGLAAWRRFERSGNRAMAADGRYVEVQRLHSQHENRHRAVDYLASFVKRIEPPTGNADYVEALEYFLTAIEANPTNMRIARHVYMVYGERRRWKDLLDLGSRRAKQYPLDWQSRLAIGLASHRLGNGQQAQFAFDSALALMDDTNRDRMTALWRILSPSRHKSDPRAASGALRDSARFAALDAGSRQAMTQLYWYMLDPIAMTRVNENRNEFLARVTWADFRWTTEDEGLLGADTDRGDIHIRYGPPMTEMVVPPPPSGGSIDVMNTLVWIYPNDQVFFFDAPPGFLSARVSRHDKAYIDVLRDETPARFANVPVARHVDSIPIALTRFRASHDSADVVVAASIPMHTMMHGLEMNEATVAVGIRLLDKSVNERGIDSTRHVVAPLDVKEPMHRSWVRRVGPGLNIVRVEAHHEDSRRSARALVQTDAGLGHGFGISDILLGSPPQAKPSVTPHSWRDIETTPGTGVFNTTQIGLTWEVYELASANGQSDYRVEIDVERITKGLRGFTARLLDDAGRVIGREQRGVNRLKLSYPRQVAAAPTVVDFVTVNLGDASAGAYRLVLTIIDGKSGRRSTRATTFSIGR